MVSLSSARGSGEESSPARAPAGRREGAEEWARPPPHPPTSGAAEGQGEARARPLHLIASNYGARREGGKGGRDFLGVEACPITSSMNAAVLPDTTVQTGRIILRS